MTSLGITQDVGNLDLESLIVITTMFFRIIGVSLDNSNRSPVERLSISHSAIRNPHSAINVPIASAATGCVQARSSFHAVPVYRDDILVRSRIPISSKSWWMLSELPCSGHGAFAQEMGDLVDRLEQCKVYEITFNVFKKSPVYLDYVHRRVSHITQR